MMLHHGPKPDAAYAQMLRRLVESKGLTRYAFFFVAEEGRKLPNGLEETSGHVVDASQGSDEVHAQIWRIVEKKIR